MFCEIIERVEKMGYINNKSDDDRLLPDHEEEDNFLSPSHNRVRERNLPDPNQDAPPFAVPKGKGTKAKRKLDKLEKENDF